MVRMKHCPLCGRAASPVDLACECGYDFVSHTHRAKREATSPGGALRAAQAGIVALGGFLAGYVREALAAFRRPPSVLGVVSHAVGLAALLGVGMFGVLLVVDLVRPHDAPESAFAVFADVPEEPMRPGPISYRDHLRLFEDSRAFGLRLHRYGSLLFEAFGLAFAALAFAANWRLTGEVPSRCWCGEGGLRSPRLPRGEPRSTMAGCRDR